MKKMGSIQQLRDRWVAAGLVGVVVAAAAVTLAAHGGDRAASPVGTWAIEVQVRNCQSQAAIGMPFLALMTFHNGGTLSESSGAEAAFAIGQRSPGHGTWEKIGRQAYAVRAISLVLFETGPNLPGTPAFNPSLPIGPGFFKGWDTIAQTVRFSDSDHFTASGTRPSSRTMARAIGKAVPQPPASASSERCGNESGVWHDDTIRLPAPGSCRWRNPSRLPRRHDRSQRGQSPTHLLGRTLRHALRPHATT